MKWEITIKVTCSDDQSHYTGYPGEDVEPYFEFESLDDLVRFLRRFSRITGNSPIWQQYIDRVKKESEIMNRVTGGAYERGRALDKFITESIRKELTPTSKAATDAQPPLLGDSTPAAG